MKLFRSFALALTIAASTLTASASAASLAAANEKVFTIGTGGVTGVYFPAGGAMCALVKKAQGTNGAACYAEVTNGSIYNLNALRSGEIDFGIAQSDMQYLNYTGNAYFKNSGPFKELRSVFSLHSEPFTLIARRDSGIKSFEDLKGKRINLGPRGSGMRATMEMLMHEYGWDHSAFQSTSEMDVSEEGKALCNNEIDAMTYAAGHPNGAIQEISYTCDVVIVPLTGEKVEALLKQYPFYSKAVIRGGIYTGNPQDIPTFGVKATLVTSSKINEQEVYDFTKAIFSNLNLLKAQHPVMSNLTPDQMIHDGNTAPLHPGAARYYREQGWIK